MSDEMYQEVQCGVCGVRFYIEVSRGQPEAPVCTKCSKRIVSGIRQQVEQVHGSSEGSVTKGELDGKVR